MPRRLKIIISMVFAIATLSAALFSAPPQSGVTVPDWPSFKMITADFLAASDKGAFLRQIRTENVKLSETLLLYQDILADSQYIEKTRQRAYTHYIINTDGPYENSQIDNVSWLDAYAQSLQIEFQSAGSDSSGFASLFSLEYQATIDDRTEIYQASFDDSEVDILRNVGRWLNILRYGRKDIISVSLFPFQPDTLAHTRENAMWMSEFSSLVYFRKAFCEAQLKQWGCEKFYWIEDSTNDTQAFIANWPGYTVVSFRGTESFTDLVTDINFFKKTSEVFPGKIHGGFLKAAEGIWPEIQQSLTSIENTGKIFITGHSLGAALAQLNAYQSAKAGYDVAGVFLFGAPLVGNSDFSDAYNALLKTQTYLHTNNLDAVTRIPPTWLGFSCVGDPLQHFLFDKAHKISLADVSALDEESAADTTALFSKAQAAFQRSTVYLSRPEVLIETGTYSSQFDGGRLDEHGIAQYLFKFACAIVEERFRKLGILE